MTPEQRIAKLEAENVWLNKALSLMLARMNLVEFPVDYPALDRHVRHFAAIHAQKALDDMKKWDEQNAPRLQWFGNIEAVRRFVNGAYNDVYEGDQLTLVSGQRGNVQIPKGEWMRQNPYNGNIERCMPPTEKEADHDYSDIYAEARTW